jgi:putative transposase
MEKIISFKRRHFQKEIILLIVCWYLSYSLSYRDIEEMMFERGIHVDHSTINRWVLHYSVLLEYEFRKNYK